MSSFDQNAVSALAERYKACGLGDTWSGRFLSSVASSAKPPTHRGLEIVNQLMTSRGPEEIKKEIDWMLSLRQIDPSLTEFIERQATNVAKGYALSEYSLKQLKDIEARSQDIRRPPTQNEIDFIASLEIVSNSRHEMFWAHRPGTRVRLKTLFTLVKNGNNISDKDIEWIRSQFTGTIKELEATEHPVNSLRWIMRDNGTRCATALIVSAPTVSQNGRGVVVDAIVDCQRIPVPVKSLMKRPTKLSINKKTNAV